MASIKSAYKNKTIGEKGTIVYAVKDVLGRGGFGSVYYGIFKGIEVAVKRIELIDCDEEKDEFELQLKLNHENVLKILEDDEDDDFRYIVLELCAGTLEQFIRNEYEGPMPTDEQVLYQIACGVQYIHSMKLVHRDINPKNILISLTNPVVMKVSDFGLSKDTNSRGTFTLSRIIGTPIWIAPEILNKERGSVRSDIFATGCVFFYFIKRGIHPFGEDELIMINIRNGNPVNLPRLEKTHFAYGLIENMIKNKVEERTDLTHVVETLKNQIISMAPVLIDQFKAIDRSFPQLSGYCRSRFHPTEPVLACCWIRSSSVFLLKGANGSIPFSNWRIEQEFKGKTQKKISALEWNVNGTQLAAGCKDGTVIVWSYPSGRVLFEEKKHPKWVDLIAWNPFRQDVFATRHDRDGLGEELLFWNSRGENGDAEKANHFLTMERFKRIRSVAWISANQIAIGFFNGKIEICKIDEDKGTSRIVKRFKHGENQVGWDRAISDLQWNERTKYLASSSFNSKRFKIWSMDSDQPVHTLKVYSDCSSFAWRRNVKTDNDEKIDVARKDKKNFTIACGLEDGSVVIWNPLEENRKRYLPQKHSKEVKSLSFSPDGRFFASTDGKGELIIWSTETWLPVFTCQNADRDLSWMSTNSSSVPTYKLAITSEDKVNGTQLAAGCEDGIVIVWSYRSGHVFCEEKKHSDKVNLIAWNPIEQTWLPVYACRNDAHSSLSWMSTDSSSVSANKLAVLSKNKILVLEESLTQ